MAIILPDTIQAGRALLNMACPYFKAINLALVPVSRPGIRTMAVDRWARWYVDIEEVEKWSVGKIATAILHELMHLWCKHHDRLLGKDMFLANMAMDFANNSAIQLMLTWPWF